MSEFKKSSFCGVGGCAEVKIEDNQVHIRRSESPNTVLAFTKEEWRAFIAGVKVGEFDV